MPDIFQNFATGVLSANPGPAGVVLESGNFAYLPAVIAPNVLRLTLDPDGVNGLPEVVIVTAHIANALTVTVTRGAETAYGAGPARAHAIDTVWRHSLTRAAIVEMMIPAGTVAMTAAATADPGYALIDGTIIANGSTLYPAAWARIPASWKVGPDIALPDWRGCTLFMDDVGSVLGAKDGSNVHALSIAELPPITLAVNPPAVVVTIDPPAVNVTIDPPAMNVSVNPPSTAITIDAPDTWVTGSTGGESNSHTHGYTRPGASTFATGGASSAALAREAYGSSTGGNSSGHSHGSGSLHVDIPPFTAWCDIPAFDTYFDIPPFNAVANVPAFDVTVDVPAFNLATFGAGTAIDIRPARGIVNYQLKVH